MKHNTKRVLAWLAGLIALGAAGALFYMQRARLAALSTGAEPLWALPLIPLALALLALNGAGQAMLAAHFGAVMRPAEWFSLAVAANFANAVAPGPVGLGVRAAYLKRRHNLPYEAFAAAGLAYAVVSALLGCALGTLLIVLSRPGPESGLNVLLAGFGLGALLLGLLTIIRVEMVAGQGGALTATLQKFLAGWGTLNNDKRLLAGQALITLALQIVSGLALWSALYTAGISVTLLTAFTLGVMLRLINLVSLTPGNLGVQEAVLGLAAALTGLPAAAGIAAALLFRVAVMLVSGLLSPIASAYLAAQLANQGAADAA